MPPAVLPGGIQRPPPHNPPSGMNRLNEGSAMRRIEASPGKLAARSLARVWHPCTQMARAAQRPPLALVRGEGPWLFDADGRRLFDAIGSWWVNLFGHSD